MDKRWLFATLWLVSIVVIIWLADTQRAQPLFDWVKEHNGSDKLGHFLLIGGWRSLPVSRCVGARIGGMQLGSVIVAIVFVAEEFAQLKIPSRTFDYGDLAADFAGICVFDLFSRIVSRRRKA